MIRQRARSFSFAFRGLGLLFSQPNAIIELLIGVAMTGLGLVFGFTLYEWMVTAICIGAVLGAEAVNTAIEKLCDHLHPEQHPAIAKVKDLSAAAVLIVALSAAVCGVLILLPHFYSFFCATSAFTGSIP